MSTNNKYYNKPSREIFERIEKYINKNMPDSEVSAFENEMGKDELLRNEVELQQKLQVTIAVSAMREQFESKGKNTVTRKLKKIKVHYLQKYWIAAAIVAIMVIPAYWLFFEKTDLYETYYQVDPGLPTVMGVTNNYQFQDAMVDYKMEDYAQAKQKWEKIALQKSKNDTLNYYRAMADLNLKNYREAKELLNKVPKNSTFYTDGMWYKALIEIKLNNHSKAREILLQIDTEQAKKLLEKLNHN